MTTRFAIIWVLGLVTAVPYSVYYLLFHAQREQYALLISFALFWLFGYWSIIGPIIMLTKIRTLYQSFEKIHSKEQLEELLHSSNGQDVAIDLIASENKIPRFLAKKLYIRAIGILTRKGVA